MNYRIETHLAMDFIGISKSMSNKEHITEIPKFWAEFMTYEGAEEIVNHINDMGLLGICYNSGDGFDYLIGVQKDKELMGTFDEVHVPKSLWAIFESRGPLPNAIQKVWKMIDTEFFPNDLYNRAALPELEVYVDGDTSSEDYYCEVWIPIQHKL